MHPLAWAHSRWRNAKGGSKSVGMIALGAGYHLGISSIFLWWVHGGYLWKATLPIGVAGWSIFIPAALLFPAYHPLIPSIYRGIDLCFEALPNLTPDTSSTAAGSARWMKWSELKQYIKPTNKDRGVFLSWVGKYMIRYFGAAHVLIFGGSRKGKTSGLLMTLLIDLIHAGECTVTFDPRGELVGTLGDLMRKHGNLIVLNPRNLLADIRPFMRSTSWDPLGMMPSDPNSPMFLKMAMQIAKNAMPGLKGNDDNAKFFYMGSVEVMAALIMWAKMGMPTATMANVRDLIASPIGKDKEGDTTGLLKTLIAIANSTYRPAAAKASPYTIVTEGTSGVHQTVVTNTGCFDDFDIQRVCDGREASNHGPAPSWDWGCLKHGFDGKPYHVVIVCEPSDMEDFAPWLRLVFGAMINDLMKPGRGRYRPRIIFEEAALFETFEALVKLMTTGAGYGCQGIVVFHDYEEILHNYGLRSGAFTSGCDAWVALASNNKATQDLLSEQCGDKSFDVQSITTNVATGEKANQGISRSIQGYRLVKPDEIRHMGHRKTLFLIDHHHPTHGYAHLYLNTPVPGFADGCLPNPCFEEDDAEPLLDDPAAQAAPWQEVGRSLPKQAKYALKTYGPKLLPIQRKALPAPKQTRH